MLDTHFTVIIEDSSNDKKKAEIGKEGKRLEIIYMIWVENFFDTSENSSEIISLMDSV